MNRETSGGLLGDNKEKNQRKQRGTTSSAKGVHYKKETNKWIARLSTNGKRRHVGVYNTEKEAIAALEVTVEEPKAEVV